MPNTTTWPSLIPTHNPDVNHGDRNPQQPQCQLLDQFALKVQFLMAIIVFCSLLVKRHLEHPRRPFRIWLCDFLKQGIGASFVHGLNVIFSLEAGSDSKSNNPCIFYFLNVGIDTTLGVYILYLWLRISDNLLKYIEVQDADLRSGYYGDPPQFIPWIKQTILFSLSLFMMKICVTTIIYLFPILERLGAMVLSPFHEPRDEVIFVMLVFPIIMNVVQFCLVDQVIKLKKNNSNYAFEPVIPTFAEPEAYVISPDFQRQQFSGLRTSPSRGTDMDEYYSDTSLLTSADFITPVPSNPKQTFISKFLDRFRYTFYAQPKIDLNQHDRHMDPAFSISSHLNEYQRFVDSGSGFVSQHSFPMNRSVSRPESVPLPASPFED